MACLHDGNCPQPEVGDYFFKKKGDTFEFNLWTTNNGIIFENMHFEIVVNDPQTLKTTQRKIFIKLTDQQAKTDFTISLIKMGLYVDFFYLSFLLCTVYIFVCHLFRDDSG